MHNVTLFDAKTHLSRLVEELVSGKEQEVVISRHGKPVARMMPVKRGDTGNRIGLARGRFEAPEDIDGANAAIAAAFAGRKGRR